jgi:predicted TIM-barrel fold metal-dependent hydrolase
MIARVSLPPRLAAVVLLAAGLACLALTSCRRPEAVRASTENPAIPRPVPSTWVRPLIIDMHGHLDPSGAARLVRILTENGIDKVVNLSGGSYRHGPADWEAAKALADQFGGRVINFASPDWSMFGVRGWAEREAGRLQEAVDRYGFRGLKITKALGLGAVDQDDRLVAPDDPRLQPLWAKAAELGVPVSIHVADPRAFWLPTTPQNERWDELKVHPYWSYADRPEVLPWPELLQQAERLYRANPRTTFVAVHFGNAAEDLDYVDGLLDRNPNVVIDIAARVGEFGRHPAGKVRQFFLKRQDRVLFGTDMGVGGDFLMLGSNGAVEPGIEDVAPFFQAHFRYLESALRQIDHPSPIQGRWKVDAIGLPPQVLDKLYRGNALRLLDRDTLRKFAQSRPASAVVPGQLPAPAWTPAPLPLDTSPSH